MKREKLEKIFEETDSDNFENNQFKGLQILSKYTDDVLYAAEHDIIYSVGVDEIIKKLTEADAIELAKLNWIIDEELDCFACYV